MAKDKTLREAVILRGRIYNPGMEDELSDDDREALEERGFFDTDKPTRSAGYVNESLSRAIDMGEEVQRKATEEAEPERQRVTEEAAKQQQANLDAAKKANK